MKEHFWRIVNGSGDGFCTRATLKECVELLEKYVPNPDYKYWKNEPYRIEKVERRVWRPRRAALSESKERIGE